MSTAVRKLPMITIATMPEAERWADAICTQLGKTVESIIKVGQLLAKAKAGLPHGEWGRMFNNKLVPFGQRTADRLMVVAQHPTLSNSTHASNLPPSWMTLYELTKVEPKRLKAAFKEGLITPDMPRKAVAALLPPKQNRGPATKKQIDVEWDFDPVTRCFFDIEARMRQTVFELNSEGRKELFELIRQLLISLEEGIQKENI